LDLSSNLQKKSGAPAFIATTLTRISTDVFELFFEACGGQWRTDEQFLVAVDLSSQQPVLCGVVAVFILELHRGSFK